MRCIVDFGRTVEIVKYGGLVTDVTSMEVCRTIVDARKLKAEYGGRIMRYINGQYVEVY